MGSEPVFFNDKLVLFTYESELMLHTKRSNLQKAGKFANTFHFIDDLCAINDSSEFNKHFKENYLPELVSNKKQKNIKHECFIH